ncbi:MAG TPA: phenylalanine--tRNA ligase subunit beta [Rudaea sp.]|jgi:phenylalanyl-tRNA synthetase beta chain|nr:phenylalanine--tRNA ligase subunit beta [Rudaea sp.]
MKFSENWLRSLVDLSADTATLERRFNMIGHEVESLERLGASLDGVVVAEIVACEKHPQADKLQVCTVSVGNAQLQIVCGAPNARAGLKAPLAIIGAILPNGIEIKKAALRGVESNGMLCSAKELGIDADASGLLELASDAPAGKALSDYLGLPDNVIELGLTPNRADCLSLRGIAIDVAAAFDAKRKFDAIDPIAPKSKRTIDVKLNADADCPRYVGRVIEGVNPNADTPLWMSERLRRSGIRPISILVDITQYVMLELGQPMHAYDAAKLNGAIEVRRARKDEKTKLLDGRDYTLTPEYLVIADAKESVGLAGIMGGLDSRVTDTTRDIFLEAAHFAPATIMGRARNLALHTDASHRFERGVDPELPRIAMERATQLVLSIAGGTAGPIGEAAIEASLPKRHAVALRRTRLSRVLGITVPDADVERILTALDMNVERTSDGWRATPPTRRFDIEIEEDLIEEVARIHGYDNVPTHAPSGELALHLRPESEVAMSRLNLQLASSGYREAICYSFVAPELLEKWSLADGAVALANPLSADLAVMRTSLLPGLVEILQSNRNRQQERVRLFESGLVFNNASGELKQSPNIAAVACGRAQPESWTGDKRVVDFYDVKADVENLLRLGGGKRAIEFRPSSCAWLHPGRSADVVVDGAIIGIVGGLHPRLLKALDIDEDIQVFELDVASVTAGRVPRARPISRFPSVRRDIAIVVPDSVPYASIETTVRRALGAALSDLLVFDQYQGPNLGSGVKSLAIGLILQDDSRTLTDQDADSFVSRAVTALEQECHARLRG